MSDLLVQMLDKQLTFLGLDTKWAAAKGGIGSGKTMAMVWWMIRRLEEYPEANHVVVGADYDQLRRGFFPSMIAVLEEDLGWELGRDFFYRENPTPMLRFAHSDARLRAMSAELAQRIRSAEFQTIYCEEPQTWHNGNGANTFRVVANRLRHSRKSGKAYPSMKLQGRMTFNPPAIGTWLYKLIEEQWKRADYPCLTFSLRDNKLLPGLAEYIQQIETMYPPEAWPVEIDGEWATIGGDWYRGFDLTIHGVEPPLPLPRLALDPRKPILWSLDFNLEWMASVICQSYTQQRILVQIDTPQFGPALEPITSFEVKGWQRDVVYCLDEIFLHNSSTPEAVDEFVRRYGDYARKAGVYIYGDPSGTARAQTISSHNAARSNWEIVMAGLQAAGIPYTVAVRRAQPSQVDRRNAILCQFRDADGIGFVIDAKRCPNVVIDFQTVRFKPGKNEMEKDDKSEEGRKRTHLGDAISYLVEYHRAAARGEQIAIIDYMAR